MTEYAFRISNNSTNTELFRIYPDGRVTKNPDVAWDACAVALFDALEYVAARRSVQGLLEENAKLRAAIERVRALHERETRTSRFGSIVWHLCPQCHDSDGYLLVHPCPTLRALDGDA